MRRAVAKITVATLEVFLHLPEGCHICGLTEAYESSDPGVVLLHLQGEGLPEAHLGDSVSQVQFIYEKVDNETILRIIEEC